MKAGADLIGVGDAAASLVGPQIYDEFVWPYEKKLVDGIHALGGKVRLHICGNTRRILEGMGKLGCDIVDLDSMAPISEARQKMGPNTVLLGNLNPVTVLRNGDPAGVTAAIAECHRQAGARVHRRRRLRSAPRHARRKTSAPCAPTPTPTSPDPTARHRPPTCNSPCSSLSLHPGRLPRLFSPLADAARLQPPQPAPLSPAALAATPDGTRLFIACATANQVAVFDLASGAVTKRISVPRSPSGLALSPDGARLYVTCAAPQSSVRVLDTGSGKTLATLPAGHTAMAPVLSPDGKDPVRLQPLQQRHQRHRSARRGRSNAASRSSASRWPPHISRDGRFLLVANHLHNGPADAERVAAVVSVIDIAARKVVKELALPDGSGLLNDLRVSPGRQIRRSEPHSAPLPPARDPA